MYFSIFI